MLTFVGAALSHGQNLSLLTLKLDYNPNFGSLGDNDDEMKH